MGKSRKNDNLGAPEKSRILIVCNRPRVVKAVEGRLEKEARVVVVGLAADGLEAVQKARETIPNIVLMDLSLPGLSGLTATRRMQGEIPGIKIVAYAGRDEEKNIRRAMQAGVTGYVLKNSSLSTLLCAIERAHLGYTFFDPKIKSMPPSQSHVNSDVEKPLQSDRSGGSVRCDATTSLTAGYGLSEREKQILTLIAQGLTMKDVAQRLRVSYKTLIPYYVRIYRKLDVHTRGEVVAKAIREKLV